MAENACVSWVVCDDPWVLEEAVIHEVDVPLNLDQNRHNRFHAILASRRSEAVQRARALPVLPNLTAGTN